MKIGSHVSMNGKEMLVGSVKEALSYEANTFMFYTGAPQNTKRKSIEELNIEVARKLMIENNINIKDLVVHAPYIINIANSIDESKYKFAKEFLQVELERVSAIGCELLVFHPGSHVKAGTEKGIEKIIEALNELLDPKYNVKIILETMSGKGSEIGGEFLEIASIIKGLKHPELVGVCIDTCHLHDYGYDLTKFDEVLTDFDKTIGLDKLLVAHINDSKNERGAKKDRHENIGFGYIGFEILNNIVHHPKLKDVPKILETPYVGEFAPYKLEIEMLKNQVFNPQLKEILLEDN